MQRAEGECLVQRCLLSTRSWNDAPRLMAPKWVRDNTFLAAEPLRSRGLGIG